MQIKNVSVTTTDSTVEFDRGYQYAWAKNTGDNVAYISDKSIGDVKTEGVATIKSGECGMVTINNGVLHCISDSTTILEVKAQNIPNCPFKSQGKGGGGSSVIVEPLSVTANDTYTAPTGSAYSPVTVNVRPNVGFKRFTQNGEYYASDDGYDGYLSVVVGVEQGVEKINRAEWNNYTTAQKQAKGLIAIQDTSTGFERGVLVNGADYIPTGVYLPNTSVNNVLCEAYYNNFSLSKLTWGSGTRPVQYMYSALKPTTWFEEVICDAVNKNVIPYVDLGETNTSFTAYFVGRITTGNSGSRLISCVYAQSNDNGIVLYKNSNGMIEISKWGDAIPTTFPSNQSVVIAIKNTNVISTSNTTKIFLYAGDSIVTETEEPTNIGRYLTIARTDIDLNTIFASPSEVSMQYLAVVNEAEADATIEANIRNLYDEFIAGE